MQRWRARETCFYESTRTLQFTALRDLGRLKLAVGDTATAIMVWRRYLDGRGRAEPSARKIDDEIRTKLADVEHAKR